MSFVELPGANDGNPHQIHFIENDPQSSNRAFQNGGVGQVKSKTFFKKKVTGCISFFSSLIGQVDIGPTRKPIFQIPLTLTMP